MPQDVQALARSGASGRHPQNEERDVMRLAKRLFPFPLECYHLRLRLEKSAGSYELAEDPVIVPVLIPYEMAHAIAMTSNEQFTQSFLGESRRHAPSPPPTSSENLGSPDLAEFWTWALSTSWGAEHPVREVPAAQHDRVLPVLYFHDGVEIQRETEHLSWSWSPLMGRGMDSRFVLLTLPMGLMKSKAVRREVHGSIASFVGWVHQVWMQGHYPHVGFYNEPLTGLRAKSAGAPLLWRGGYIGFKSDLKARAEANRFARWYKTTHLCERCLATQPFKRADRSLNYQDFRPSAGYTLTELSHAEYMAWDTSVSPWSQIGGWHLHTVYYDMMHVIWLGIARVSTASFIIELVEKGQVPGGTVGSRLESLTTEYANWCYERRLSKPKFAFTLSGLNRARTQMAYPELATYWKASRCKTLAHFCSWKAAL